MTRRTLTSLAAVYFCFVFFQVLCQDFAGKVWIADALKNGECWGLRAPRRG